MPLFSSQKSQEEIQLYKYIYNTTKYQQETNQIAYNFVSIAEFNKVTVICNSKPCHLTQYKHL